MTLSKLARENKLIAVMGDFNIDLLKYNDHTASNDFINMMFSYNFQPTILHPTHITDTSSTNIDNSYVNNSTQSNIFAGNILSLLSEHLPQLSILSDDKPDYTTTSHYTYDYKNFDAVKCLADYNEMDTTVLEDGGLDLNEKFDNFLLNLHTLVNKHCTKKKLNRKALKLKNKPWINCRIQRMIKIRDSLFTQYNSSSSPGDLNTYKQFQNRIVLELRESKRATIISTLKSIKMT